MEKAWNEMFGQQNPPTFEQISEYVNNGLWEEINEYLQSTYKVSPKLTYSKCSMQNGWNVKYQKSGKSLCTLYPMDGYFIALVVVGSKELTETELFMPSCTSYLQNLFAGIPYSTMGKWLMINVTDNQILDDIKNLIKIRVSTKK